MSYDEESIKKLLNTILSSPEQTEELFKVLQLKIKERKKSINEAQSIIKKLKPLIDPKYGDVLDIVDTILTTNKENNDTFEFIYYMLELLVMKGHNQKPLSETKLMYNPEHRLTDEDRKNLDWLKKYFEHSRDNNIGQ